MRKSINGRIIVSESLSLDPLSQSWFVFCNKQRDKLKILFWDTNGFWLYYLAYRSTIKPDTQPYQGCRWFK